MTEKTSVLQEHDPQISQAHEPQLPQSHTNKSSTPAVRSKRRKSSTPAVHSKRRKSHRKEMREWIAAIVQLAGVVAVVVSLAGLMVNIQQFHQQQQVADLSTLDQRHQATLDTYIDQMSTLLLQYNLAHAQSGGPVQAVAQARTYTALRNLDPARQGTLIRFLWGARLITGSPPIISLSIVNIVKADLSYAYLYTINLGGALLMSSNFHESDLTKADLDNTHMNDTDLSGTLLIGANLTGADLTSANLSGKDTDLTGANLTNANLAGANLSGANLTNANLIGANLAGANLAGATLAGATMPDGSQQLLPQPR